jgi:hypothetical protein
MRQASRPALITVQVAAAALLAACGVRLTAAPLP